jgi:hypothetical protein
LGQQRSLIVAALSQTVRVEWNGDERVRFRFPAQFLQPIRETRAQRICKRRNLLIFESVHSLLQSTCMNAGCGGDDAIRQRSLKLDDGQLLQLLLTETAPRFIDSSTSTALWRKQQVEADIYPAPE